MVVTTTSDPRAPTLAAKSQESWRWLWIEERPKT